MFFLGAHMVVWLFFPFHSNCSGLHLSIFFIYFKPQTQSLSEFFPKSISLRNNQLSPSTVSLFNTIISKRLDIDSESALPSVRCFSSTDENCSCSLKPLLWAEQLQLLLDAATVPWNTGKGKAAVTGMWTNLSGRWAGTKTRPWKRSTFGAVFSGFYVGAFSLEQRHKHCFSLECLCPRAVSG